MSSQKRGPSWTREEEDRLIEAYVRGGTAAAVEACPGRTGSACRRRISDLGGKVGAGIRQQIAVSASVKRLAGMAERNKPTLDDVLALRRRGLSVAEICDECGLSETAVHAMLAGQPRRIRLRGEGIGEVTA